MKKEQLIIFGIVGVALYLIVTGLSYVGFSYGGRLLSRTGPAPIPTGTQGHFVVDPNAPKTEACPLNGKFYTVAERKIWESRGPLAVMIENHQEARPQSGLSSADVVYEAVAEGGITRFMAVFYCGVAASTNVAPVRSARAYFLPWVLEYNALYNHVGGAGNCNDDTVDDRAKALCEIQQYKIKDMDQFGISFPTCYRNYDRLDHPVATEHTMVCVTDKLYQIAAQRGWTNVDASGVPWNKNFVSWTFKDDASLGDRSASFSASFVAWKGYEADYGVRWDYDKATDTYRRTNGGVAQVDFENKQPITAKVVIIQFAKEIGPLDVHVHLFYTTIGSGDGLVLEDGKVTKVTWQKQSLTSRTKYYDATGKEVSLDRGQIWIELLPIGTPVAY